MLNNIDARLTGDVLKILCDMGLKDELVIADANFPAESIAKRLSKDDKGKTCGSINNAIIIFRNDPLFEGNIRENLFNKRIELSGAMLWSRTGIELSERDDTHIKYRFEYRYWICEIAEMYAVRSDNFETKKSGLLRNIST